MEPYDPTVTLAQVVEQRIDGERAAELGEQLDRALESRGLPAAFKRALGSKAWMAAALGDQLVEHFFPGASALVRIATGVVAGLAVETGSVLAAPASKPPDVGYLGGHRPAEQKHQAASTNHDEGIATETAETLRQALYPDSDILLVRQALEQAAASVALVEQRRQGRLDRHEGTLIRAMSRHGMKM